MYFLSFRRHTLFCFLGKLKTCLSYHNDGYMSLHIYPKSRMNSNVNCEFEVIMVCRCRFLHCMICTTLMGYVDDGGD